MKKKFTYALGEILIVIVGISIAFTMNKCSENSKSEALKQQYLENIKSDIEIDKKILNQYFNPLIKKLKL
ncbi:hypothetical protein [Gaetbulibacter sp. PBL-D1]|uniref:hypothetical protein n=1 Tax=Gaetbulibacter sp. PBL-D1 TaxID=3422594 RepID=UPI003D2EFBA3